MWLRMSTTLPLAGHACDRQRPGRKVANALSSLTPRGRVLGIRESSQPFGLHGRTQTNHRAASVPYIFALFTCPLLRILLCCFLTRPLSPSSVQHVPLFNGSEYWTHAPQPIMLPMQLWHTYWNGRYKLSFVLDWLTKQANLKGPLEIHTTKDILSAAETIHDGSVNVPKEIPAALGRAISSRKLVAAWFAHAKHSDHTANKSHAHFIVV